MFQLERLKLNIFYPMFANCIHVLNDVCSPFWRWKFSSYEIIASLP